MKGKQGMNYQVNFQKAKRNYMVLTFDDEREENGKTVQFEKKIEVGMPKKRVFTALLNAQELIDELGEAQTAKEKTEANRKIIDELYELTATILSNNLRNERITTEWVEEQFTIKELKEFLTDYTKFTNGEAVNPN